MVATSKGPPILDVTNQVSKANRRVAWTTALLNVPYVRGYVPSRPRILDILAHCLCAFLIFETTSGQLLYDAMSTLPRYLNSGTVSKGLL